jgi:hypothetical protein
MMGTHNPGVLQGHHVVDGHVAGIRVLLALVRARPASRGRVAVIAGLDVVAVASQDVLAVLCPMSVPVTFCNEANNQGI